MSSENYILISGLIGLVLGIFIMILFSYYKQSKSISLSDKLNVEERISPFIEVHKSLPIAPEQEQNFVSRVELKRKIESLKNRNRFYQL